jgi:hypothetical protein
MFGVPVVVHVLSFEKNATAETIHILVSTYGCNDIYFFVVFLSLSTNATAIPEIKL